MDPERWELVDERPANSTKEMHSKSCEHSGGGQGDPLDIRSALEVVAVSEGATGGVMKYAIWMLAAWVTGITMN